MRPIRIALFFDSVLAPPHCQGPAGKVRVGQAEPSDLHGAHGMDGDQDDDEPRGFAES